MAMHQCLHEILGDSLQKAVVLLLVGHRTHHGDAEPCNLIPEFLLISGTCFGYQVALCIVSLQRVLLKQEHVKLLSLSWSKDLCLSDFTLSEINRPVSIRVLT